MQKKLIAAIAGMAAAFVVAAPGLAHTGDTNRDRIPDKWEKRFHLSLNVNQAGRDQDNDGLDNRCEFEEADNPRDADTDDDGVRDENEIEERQCENEPNDTNDGDHHNRGPGSQDSGSGSHHD
jgi:hypothetical protein